MFSDVTISEYEDDYKVSHKVMEEISGPRVFTMQVDSDKPFFFIAQWPNKRFFKRDSNCSQDTTRIKGFMARVTGGDNLSNYTYDNYTKLGNFPEVSV
jgi:hypothetical protein